MRFRLLNDVSSVQHYILGHLFSSVLKKFNQNVEESCDLDTLIEAHSHFINTMYSFCQKLRDNDKESYGFAKVRFASFRCYRFNLFYVTFCFCHKIEILDDFHLEMILFLF